jgi:glycosyltransferase involved in cell wall biosynthesis
MTVAEGSRARASAAPILVVTSSTRGGSWRWIQEVIQAAGLGSRCTVVAYGRRDEVGSGVQGAVILPFLSYDKIGLWMSSRPALVPIYHMLLAIATYASFVRWRPRVIIANGVFLTLLCVPYVVISRARLFLAFHGYIGAHPRWLLGILRVMMRPVHLAMVNSSGSEKDLAAIMPLDRICRVEHWADDIYFEAPEPYHRSDERLRVLYVGRQDEEKVGFLLSVIESCARDQIEFVFVGSGPYAERIAKMSPRLRVTHLGYIEDKRSLAEIYRGVDLLWGVADDTYVAKPVVEALACGTPVIIPDVPAVSAKAAQGVRIPRDIIPPEVGWVIDGRDVTAARELLLRIGGERADRTEACRAYATLTYSKRNLLAVVGELSGSRAQ